MNPGDKVRGGRGGCFELLVEKIRIIETGIRINDLLGLFINNIKIFWGAFRKCCSFRGLKVLNQSYWMSKSGLETT